MSHLLKAYFTASLFFGVAFAAPNLENYDYKIVVNYQDLLLQVYDQQGNPVTLSEQSDHGPVKLDVLPITGPPRKASYWGKGGYISKVVVNPYWQPTPGTIRAYERRYNLKLPENIAPGDSRNAMGKFKIYIQFDEPVGMPIRIHGTNHPEQISMRISRGCIRTLNEQGKLMLERLAGRPLDEEFASNQTVEIEVAPTRVVFE